MKLLAAALTDPGLVRKNNEDACLADDATGLLVVADGMGGHAAGEVASGLAVDVVREQVALGLRTGLFPAVEGSPLHLSKRARLLHAAVALANEAVFRASRERVERNGMGTTIVALLANGRRISLAHVGDSRAYLFRAGEFRPLTRDHSFVEEQVARGAMTREEAERSDAKNVLTRALGIAATVDVDVSEPLVKGGDVVLLCSDGLSKMVEDKEIARLLDGLSDPVQMCNNLVKLSLDRGGRDNVTVAVGRFAGGATLWNRVSDLWRATRRKPPAEGGGTHG
jgi:protein phosphatase